MNESISDINYKEVMEYSLNPLIVHTQLKIIYINEAAEKFFRASKEDVIGASPIDIFKETSKPAIVKRISGAYSEPAELIEETIFRMDGSTVDVELYCHPIKIGDTKAIQTYVNDITERKVQEQEHNEMNKQIDALASTIVPLMAGIAVLPLLGKINQERTIKLLELVPINVQKQNVRNLIIDFSGIYKLDSIVINYLFNITNVLKLLGVECILTGIRSELAMEAIQLGINPRELRVFSDVRQALSFLGMNVNR
ncbi:PAS domain S-box protein [Bacillus suaedaesalsae]|uniref:PAS domain S-box protein n=1 Tax=Bacillus suaedaesalsae TaxID=2810349 RepID=A0ABS2DH96_9BACI|nr:PAS domain S-box protein [Bacillus suaedaesalsae]MBM6617823.1 PAS domain S-box protein [Bacillus suaedaesalsae]